ncbi:hypothetical protein ZEAMMB73_Zm00001d020964 [Zea mays]|uniref:Late embryogenesis abundant protein LEA-2 subgroup domain-containing protein n=2 Tax=Zea mays TaxID=4577 RepID=A0A1D6I7A4_MAIZE|nr:hypothetical protein ZEAMMB73_Zm00001d020964 [Zea mays]
MCEKILQTTARRDPGGSSYAYTRPPTEAKKRSGGRRTPIGEGGGASDLDRPIRHRVPLLSDAYTLSPQCTPARDPCFSSPVRIQKNPSLITVLVLAFGVVFLPKATADDAVLQRFALAPADPASNSIISFNVTATVSLRNPNMYRAIEYGALVVTFSFNGTRFNDSVSVSGFKHKARKTATQSVRVDGVGKPIKLTRPGVGEFRTENDTGSFGVEMRLDTMLQYKGRSHPTFTPPRVVATADLTNDP